MNFDLASLLVFATPVALAALGETIVQKAGLINIGLEGVMLTSAFFGMLASYSTHSPWLGLVGGASAGLMICLLQAAFTIRMAVDQVVAGTAVNLLAMGLTGSLFRARFGQSGQLLSVAQLPKFVGVDVVVLLTLALAPTLAWVIARTRWGLAVRTSGEYPDALEAAGLSAQRVRWQALAVGGLLGGLAGAYLSLGISGSFAENMTAGRGFIAIAMVTFGRWSPIWVLMASLLVGYAESLQFAFQARQTAIPFQFFVALPYLIALAVLAFVGKGSPGPASLGREYRKRR